MYNQITLVGNFTRDVEIRYSSAGNAIANVGIATSRKWKDQSGQQKEEVMFIDLTLFSRHAEIANQYLRKGSKVLIAGRLQLQQWEKDGVKKSKHVVVVENLQMLDSKADSQNSDNSGGYGGQVPVETTNANGQTTKSTYQQPSQGYGQSQPQQQQSYGQQPQASQQPSYGQSQAPQQPSVPGIDIDDQDIPF